MRAVAFVYVIACSAVAALAAPATTCTVDDRIAIVKSYSTASAAGHPDLVARIPFAEDTVYTLEVAGDPLQSIAAGIKLCQGAAECKKAVATLDNVISKNVLHVINPEPEWVVFIAGTTTFGAENLGVVTMPATGNISFNAACQITRTIVRLEPLGGVDVALLANVLGTSPLLAGGGKGTL